LTQPKRYLIRYKPFRAAGFIFTKEWHHDTIPQDKSKVTPESLVEKLLKKRMVMMHHG